MSAPEVSSISPARISPVSCGTLTIVGSELDTVTSVFVEGRASTIETQTDSVLTVTWPKRVTNANFDYSGGSVDVVLTNPDGSATVKIEYLSTRDGKAVQSINGRLAYASVQNGFFYDWSASEIVGFQVDPSTWQTGTWKKVVSYLESADEIPDSECGGFRSYRYRGRLDAVLPLKNLKDGTQESSLILSDLTRAVMLDISNGGITDTTRITRKDVMVVEGLSPGALLVAGVGYEFDLQHVENDPTQNISWTSIQQGG